MVYVLFYKKSVKFIYYRTTTVVLGGNYVSDNIKTISPYRRLSRL